MPFPKHDHALIYLEPSNDVGERQWCQDDVWGDGKATKYIRADLMPTVDGGQAILNLLNKTYPNSMKELKREAQNILRSYQGPRTAACRGLKPKKAMDTRTED